MPSIYRHFCSIQFLPNPEKIKRSGRCGFTLIELLLGTAVFSIIILTVYSVFFAALKVREQSSFYQDTVYRMSLALESMARDLENAVGYNFANSYPEIKAFNGKQDSIIFVQSSGGVLQFVSYELEAVDPGHRHEVKIGVHSDKNIAITQQTSEGVEIYQLVRTTRPFVDHLNDFGEHAESRVICRNIAAGGLEFSFAAMNPDSRERSWQSAWPFNAVPALVKIRLTSAPLSSGQTVELNKNVLNPAGTMIVQ